MKTPWNLLERYLEDSLTEPEAEELRTWLKTDDEHLRTLLRAAHLETSIPLALQGTALRVADGLTESIDESEPALAPRFTSPPTASRPTSRPHRRVLDWTSRWPLAIAATLAVLSTLSWFLPFNRPAASLPVIESFEGAAPAIQRAALLPPVSENAPLREGDILQTRAGRATLAYLNEATRIELGEHTALRIRTNALGNHLELIAGSARFGMARRPSSTPLTIATTHARVRGLGATFQMLASPKTTRIRVTEGAVELEREAIKPITRVSAGSMAIARVGTPLVFGSLNPLTVATESKLAPITTEPGSLTSPAPPPCPTGLLDSAPNERGAVLREFWTGLPGTEVSDLLASPNYPRSPSGHDYPTSLETVEGGARHDAYGTRWRGYLHPPRTGSYTFWIASDDQSELSLSPDPTPAGKRRIARVTRWTAQREWTKFTDQESDLVELEAGRRYYFEILHKEGGGGDHLSVAWQPPGGEPTVITATYLSPYFP